MDKFKTHKDIGPGGSKCPCCTKGTKAEMNQAARARLKADLRKVAAEEVS